MKIRDFMTGKVLTVNENMNVKECIRLMEEHNITGAPVTDNSGKIVGVVSVTDVIKRSNYVNKELSHCDESYEVDPCTGRVEVHKYYTDELFEKAINTLMTKKLISLSPEDTLDDAVKIFMETPVHRILVMEKDKVVGIISTKDTIKALQKALKKKGA